MLVQNAMFVIIGAATLTVALYYAFGIVAVLNKYNLALPWIVLSALISFFLFGYLFIALKFLGLDLIPSLTLESLVTSIFFFGAVFILVLAVLNRNLFANIFGVGISDSEALTRFAAHINLPVRLVVSMIQPKYSVGCDICNQPVQYSIPDIVRAHPSLDRGVIVEKAMGGVNYRFFVRHYCGKELREIPVRHDSQFEYRSNRPSRPV